MLPPSAAQTRIREAPPDPGAALLFHASFDVDRRADLAIGPDVPYLARYARAERGPGGGRHIDGVFGKALSGSTGGELGEYDALGNVNPERGTVAFFVRETEQLYGFEMLTINTVDPYYWHMYGRFSNKSNALSAWFANELYRPHIAHAPGTARLKEGVWHHIAVTWDQAYGSRFYFDGKEVASNWGEATWFSRGVDLDKLVMVHSDNVAYDELYVFDRPLSAGQIAALCERNRPPERDELRPLAFDEAHRVNRLRELSWEQDDRSRPVVELGRSGLGGPTSGRAANAVRQVVPLQARFVKKEGNEVFDGKLGGGWPPLYAYEYNNGNGLHVELPEPYDLMTIEGRFAGRIYGRRMLVEDGTKPLLSLDGEQFATHVRFPRPRPAGWLSFFKALMEDKGELPDKELVTQSRICELGFFRMGSHQLDGASARSYYIGPLQPSAGTEALQAELLGRYGPGDRATSVLAARPPGDGPAGQKLPALRYHHLVIPGADQDVPLRGLRLVWRLMDDSLDNALDITVHDPLQPGRRIFHLDFALHESATVRSEADATHLLDLTLDLSDRLVPAGRPLWISFCFKRDVALLWGDGEHKSRVDLLVGSRDEVLPEYVRTELAFAKNRFREMSEPRPWGAHEHPEVDMPAVSREARELFVPLRHLWELQPDHPKVRALWLWTHKYFEDSSPVEPLPVPACENAPRWALLQRELFDLSTGVLYWWIENRQTPNGELGDGWGDDTDLIQNFAKLALIRDPGGRLRKAVKAVADGVYGAGRIKNGINARTTDTLHAYEEGVNAQPVMALIDYGNPLYVERMMAAAKTVEEHLTAINKHGRRRFRSWYFGADEVREKGRYGADHPGNALFCHPALFLSFYSRHPRTVKFLREWVDGWLELYERDLAQGLDYPKHTLFDDTQVISRDYKCRGYGYVDLYPALYRMTGERRYQEAERFWTEPKQRFMRGANYMPALQIIDREKHRQDLIDWAREANLTRIANDSMGIAARQRIVEWEVSGEERAAYEALEGCVRKLRLTFEAHTWAEPINDRIWLPDHPMVVMMQGGMSDQRNQLYPRHYVSYGPPSRSGRFGAQAFSDFAAWVREKTDEHLRLWLYSFAPRAEEGLIRVWRTPLGTYRVTIGPDADEDGRPDAGSETRQMMLHRFAGVPVTLPPRQLMAVDIVLIEKSREDFWTRPDLAVTSDDAQWSDDGDALTVVLHNVGNSPAQNVVVRLADQRGKTLAERTVPSIEAPLDLVPRRVPVTFTGLKGAVGRRRAVHVQVDPENAIVELNAHNNTARMRTASGQF